MDVGIPELSHAQITGCGSAVNSCSIAKNAYPFTGEFSCLFFLYRLFHKPNDSKSDPVSLYLGAVIAAQFWCGLHAQEIYI